MGYRWSGGVRSIEAIIIPRDRSTTGLLCNRLPELPGERDGQGMKKSIMIYQRR